MTHLRQRGARNESSTALRMFRRSGLCGRSPGGVWFRRRLALVQQRLHELRERRPAFGGRVVLALAENVEVNGAALFRADVQEVKAAAVDCERTKPDLAAGVKHPSTASRRVSSV